MSKSRWTADEDLLLVEKHKENDGNFDMIYQFFPKRNKRSLMKRYLRLKQKSKETGVSMLEYIESNRKDTIDIIQELLCTENRNDKILANIINHDYTTSDVVRAILLLSNEYDSICLKLVSIFQYLLKNWTDGIYEDLYNLSEEIQSDLFLQICCFLNVVNYDDLKTRLSFINDIGS